MAAGERSEFEIQSRPNDQPLKRVPMPKSQKKSQRRNKPYSSHSSTGKHQKGQKARDQQLRDSLDANTVTVQELKSDVGRYLELPAGS